jgi:S1-C subfamily serine protease
MTDEYVWTCPKCARTVPNGFETCRCGTRRTPVAPEQAISEPVHAPEPARRLARRVAGFNRKAVVLTAVVVGMLATLVAAGIFSHPAEQMKPLSAPSPAATPTLPGAGAKRPERPRRHDERAAADDTVPAAEEEAPVLSTHEIVARAMPAIVSVETSDGVGSGFFVAPDTVVTNYHVVNANTAIVLRRGDYTRTAKVEKSSPELDLAILKPDVVEWDQVVLPLVPSGRVHAGSDVVAIGSALSSAISVTNGVVSGLSERNGVRLIQIDADINSANRGGPLFDRSGRVVGVNTAKLAAGSEGKAFAVSIDYARAMLGPRAR